MDSKKSISDFPELDLKYLREVSGGNEEFVQQIIEIFIEDTPSMLNNIRESYAKGDFEKVKFYTHKLTSQLPMVGLNGAVDDARLIEKECNSLPDLEDRINGLIDFIEKGIEKLKQIKF